MTCRPTTITAQSANSGSTFNAQGTEPSPWINFAFGGVQHYGLKLAITAGTTSSVQKWWISCRLTVAMKQLR